MTVASILFGLVLLVVIVYLFTKPGSYRVIETESIDVPIDELFNKLVDLRAWPEWNPWLLHEPDAKLNFSDEERGENSWYEWQGKTIGSGRLSLMALEKPEKIHCRIEFLKPFKSRSSVHFELRANGENSTQIDWIMQGRMPFLLRFMTQKMARTISRDYRIGLARLNALLNPSANGMELEFIGPVKLPAMNYLASPYEATSSDIAEKIRAGLAELNQFVQAHAVRSSGPTMNLIHEMDQGEHFIGEVGMPINSATEGSEKITRQSLAGGAFFQVRYIGAYDHMELAWHAAFSHLQMCKLKADTKRPALEIYERPPEQVDNPNYLCTSIYIPLKES
jgi:effector-binding domain-containing protein